MESICHQCIHYEYDNGCINGPVEQCYEPEDWCEKDMENFNTLPLPFVSTSVSICVRTSVSQAEIIDYVNLRMEVPEREKSSLPLDTNNRL